MSNWPIDINSKSYYSQTSYGLYSLDGAQVHNTIYVGSHAFFCSTGVDNQRVDSKTISIGDAKTIDIPSPETYHIHNGYNRAMQDVLRFVFTCFTTQSNYLNPEQTILTILDVFKDKLIHHSSSYNDEFRHVAILDAHEKFQKLLKKTLLVSYFKTKVPTSYCPVGIWQAAGLTPNFYVAIIKHNTSETPFYDLANQLKINWHEQSKKIITVDNKEDFNLFRLSCDSEDISFYEAEFDPKIVDLLYE